MKTILKVDLGEARKLIIITSARAKIKILMMASKQSITGRNQRRRVTSKMKNRIPLKISLTVSKRKRRSKVRKENKIVIAAMMFKGQIILRNLKIRRTSAG